jgi:hypothetical protein
MLSALRSLGYTPVVSTHVIYELAKCFLVSDGVERGRLLFAFLDDLDPTFHWPPQEMIEREVQRLRLRTTVLPFLDFLNYTSAVFEVRRLRAGIVSDEARRLIMTREADIAANVPRERSRLLGSGCCTPRRLSRCASKISLISGRAGSVCTGLGEVRSCGRKPAPTTGVQRGSTADCRKD